MPALCHVLLNNVQYSSLEEGGFDAEEKNQISKLKLMERVDDQGI